jgi:hypothetical protein
MVVRFGTLFWVGLVALLGSLTFAVSYSVQALEEDLLRVRTQTAVEQREMRVLDAEWTYLTQPARLEELNERFLSLVPISTQQLSAAIADIPLRATEVAADAAPVGVAAEAGEKRPPRGDPSASSSPAHPAPPPAPQPSEETATKPMPSRPAAAHSLDALFAQVAGAR